jgi:tRNA wybutosine-synthesizing protein 1
MTPVVDKCTQTCDFCWRVVPSDIGCSWDQLHVSAADVLPPDELLDATLMANLRSLGGYNPRIGANVTEKMYQEARNPKHVAISLAGEPTLYPFLSGFIEEINRRHMTSFLVTNGTNPNVLAETTLPTQLYVTLAASDAETQKKLLHPHIPNAWKLLNESQELLQSLNCRKVNRLTMVAGHNMHDPRGFSKMILKGEPDFVEVKGYMFLGSSRGRLKKSNAPSHREIRAFSEKLAALTGYYLLDEQIESRVVLLSRSKQIKRLQ